MESQFQRTATTKVEFLRKLPSAARLSECIGFAPEKFLVIYDQRLVRAGGDGVKKWLEEFPLTYPVKSGEGLKDFAAFATHLKKIFSLASPFSNRSLAIVALGGGTVGDFAGFLGSILKRGVPLVHVPSTLLAAMDSSHGGKTALNVGSIKNQIGTFYPANGVMIVRSLFEGLPPLQIQSASGELAKIALLTGGELFQRFEKEFSLTLDSIWEFLPAIIAAKYKVVEKDPFEVSGERQLLNLGHSLGHALESYFALPHGVAVGEGMMFALEWSAHQGYMREDMARELTGLLQARTAFVAARDFAKQHKSMSRGKLSKLIREDKKLTDARHLNFVFMERPGAGFRKVVTIESLLTETQRQGWTAV